MEDARNNSINEIIKRAEEEKERILQYIDELIAVKLPGVIGDSRNVTENFMTLAKGINVDFNPNGEMESLINLIIDKLNNLKQKVLDVEVNEEALLGEGNSVIKSAQDIIEEVGPAIENAKEKFFASNRNSLLREFNQKKKIEDGIVKLKIEKAKLEGKLEATKNKTDRVDIEREIRMLDRQIELQEFRLLNFEFQDRDGQNSGSNGEKCEQTTSEAISFDGQEQDDGSNR